MYLCELLLWPILWLAPSNEEGFLLLKVLKKYCEMKTGNVPDEK